MFNSNTELRLKKLGVVVSLALCSTLAAAKEPVNVHAAEKIGTVQQVYDGALFPDVQVNTFRNIDRLFSTRTVTHGSKVYPLPASERPLKNFKFSSNGKDYDLSTTAEIYLSYSDPEGPAVMSRTVQTISPPVPLLWVVGTNDPLSRLGRSYVFAKAPDHPQSRYEEVLADHEGVPVNAARQVAVWLKDLVLACGGAPAEGK